MKEVCRRGLDRVCAMIPTCLLACIETVLDM